MAGSLNDTSTTLYPGTGGDVMDESLVMQTDGTQAKRTRVVPGADDGTLQSFDNAAGRVAAAVTDGKAIALLTDILLEQRRQTSLLRAILSETTGVDLCNDDLDEKVD